MSAWLDGKSARMLTSLRRPNQPLTDEENVQQDGSTFHKQSLLQPPLTYWVTPGTWISTVRGSLTPRRAQQNVDGRPNQISQVLFVLTPNSPCSQTAPGARLSSNAKA